MIIYEFDVRADSQLSKSEVIAIAEKWVKNELLDMLIVNCMLEHTDDDSHLRIQLNGEPEILGLDLVYSFQLIELEEVKENSK